jgi:hypothetical protein
MSKIYDGLQLGGRPVARVNGAPLPLKDTEELRGGSDWGSESNGAEILALSMLSDCCGDEQALTFAGEFTKDVASKLKPDWEFSSEDVLQWRDYKLQLGAATQSGGWVKAGFGEPAKPVRAPAYFPRLMDNPNYRRYPKTST